MFDWFWVHTVAAVTLSLYLVGSDSVLLREWLMENHHLVSAVVFVCSTCGSRPLLKKVGEVEKGREENHIWETGITSVFLQSGSHTHSFTKAAIVWEKTKPQHKTEGSTQSNKYFSVHVVHRFKHLLNVAVLTEPETDCHFLWLWASG